MLALNDRGKSTEIFYTSIGTSAKENVVDFVSEELLARLETHILKALLERSLTLLVYSVECRYALSDANAHTWVGAVGDAWLYFCSIEGKLFVEYGIVATLQCLPISNSLIPCLSLWGILATLDISKCRFVWSYKSATRSHLDREVAEGETILHRHIANHIAGILYKIACSSRCCELAHKVQSHILCCNALTKLAVDIDAHRLRLALKDALRGHNHLDLGCTDTESHGSHCSVCRGVRVATNDSHTRQRESLLRTYNVDNAVVLRVHGKMSDTKIGRILGECVYLTL